MQAAQAVAITGPRRRKWNGSGVFPLEFRDRLGWAGGFLRGSFGIPHTVFKVMRNGRIEIAANCVGDLRNVSGASFIALLSPDGHLQNFALAMRVRALFRHLLAGLPPLPGNFLRPFAVCHTPPPT